MAVTGSRGQHTCWAVPNARLKLPRVCGRKGPTLYIPSLIRPTVMVLIECCYHMRRNWRLHDNLSASVSRSLIAEPGKTSWGVLTQPTHQGTQHSRHDVERRKSLPPWRLPYLVYIDIVFWPYGWHLLRLPICLLFWRTGGRILSCKSPLAAQASRLPQFVSGIRGSLSQCISLYLVAVNPSHFQQSITHLWYLPRPVSLSRIYSPVRQH